MDAGSSGDREARWRLYVLGPPRLERDGVAVPLGLRKAMALLAYLAVTGQAHSRDALATLLWPEHAPADGRARLRRTVHDLTSLAGRELLVAGVDALGPAPAATLWLDSADFDRHAAAAGRAGPVELERAVALYVDDFLAGFSLPDSPAFDAWQRFQRERLRLTLATALSHLTAAGAEGAPPEAALAHARRWLALDPLHEPAQRRLMRLYAGTGQPAAALRQYEACARVLGQELGVEPEPATRALRDAVRARRPLPPDDDRPPDAPSGPSPGADQERWVERLRRPPPQPAPLIGREHQLDVACRMLGQDGVRLLTLIGPAGTGKTRLAVAVAEALAPEFADGVCFVDLAPLADPALVVAAIAQATGVRDAAEPSPASGVVRAIADRRVLLVLDNFEQVLPAAPLVAALLAACSGLAVLVTSRAALHLRWERELAVPPLAVPDLEALPPPAQLVRVPAVALFVQRAQAVAHDFALDEVTGRAVAAVCVRLDGLPLAIELAAARTKLLPPEALLARLERRLHLLVGGPRDHPTRHQTLRAAIAWSYDLLPEGDRSLFRRLGVFVGGFTLEAAEAVCSPGEAGDPATVLEGLAALVDNSLVRREREAAGAEPRYAVLETVREYALERLAAGDEAETVRARHGAYFITLAERAAAGLLGPQPAVWLERLEREHDNLRAVLARCGLPGAAAGATPGGWPAAPDGETDGGTASDHLQALRLGAALARFWLLRGHLTEGRRWLRAILDGATPTRPARPGPPVDGPPVDDSPAPGAPAAWRARALWGAGVLAREQGDWGEARERLEASLALARARDDRGLLAEVLGALGLTLVDLDDARGAGPLLKEGLAVARALGDRRALGEALLRSARLAESGGDFRRVRTLLEEALALARASGDKAVLGAALYALGRLLTLSAEEEAAQPLLEEGLAVTQEVGPARQVVQLRRSLGRLALRRGDTAGATLHHQAGLAAARTLGDRAGIGFALVGLAQVRLKEDAPDLAAPLLQEALTLFTAVGHHWGRGSALGGLADVARRRGDTAGVAALLREQLMLWHGLDDRLGVVGCLDGAAVLAAEGGDPARAARLLGAAGALRQEAGLPPGGGGHPPVDQTLRATRGRLGDAAFAVAYGAGGALGLDGAVAAALAVAEAPLGTAPPVSPVSPASPASPARRRPAFGLTQRELEVLRLLAEGAGDAEIARRLVISVRTANSHVSSILGKTGAPNRAAAAVLAQRQGLL